MMKMKRQNIRTLSLVVVTLTYLIIGAAVFDYFESSHETMLNQQLKHNITEFKTKYGMNDTEFDRLWHTILEKKPYHAGNQWKFIGSLYFCTVVVTLIGYGHSTPRTVPGKCFCIFYTLLGIPIFLIMFQSVGERLNSLIKFVLVRLKKKIKMKNQDVGLFELITVEVFFTMTITVIASYVFMKNEDWSYFDSMYYCFITLTTIGFGDFVPLQKNGSLSNNFAYACFTILFILIGLTTLASSMNLLVLRLATINAEEQLTERLEQAEARRNQVRLEGDVISRPKFTNIQDPTTSNNNNNNNVDNISVCSCACMDHPLWDCQGKRRATMGRRRGTTSSTGMESIRRGSSPPFGRHRTTSGTSLTRLSFLNLRRNTTNSNAGVNAIINSGGVTKRSKLFRFLPQGFFHTAPVAAAASAANQARLRDDGNQRKDLVELELLANNRPLSSTSHLSNNLAASCSTQHSK